jgi:hypothetical protein
MVIFGGCFCCTMQPPSVISKLQRVSSFISGCLQSSHRTAFGIIGHPEKQTSLKIGRNNRLAMGQTPWCRFLQRAMQIADIMYVID